MKNENILDEKTLLKTLVDELLKQEPDALTVKALTKQLRIDYCADSSAQMVEVLEAMNSRFPKIRNKEGSIT